MAALRRLTLVRCRWLIAFVVVALLARVLVPVGWMPSAGGGLMPCDGMAPAMVQPHVQDGRHHHPAPEAPATGDHLCAFAGPVAAIDPPALAQPVPPTPVRAVAVHRHLAAGIGRGLAAPPPPATGPPFA